MTTFGKNMKLTVSEDRRESFHRAMTEGLGCAANEVKPGLVLYGLGDGFNIGVYYVASSDALDDDQLALAPWLEVLVDDVDTTSERLSGLGVKRVEYEDKAYPYFQASGGPVFRLASA